MEQKIRSIKEIVQTKEFKVFSKKTELCGCVVLLVGVILFFFFPGFQFKNFILTIGLITLGITCFLIGFRELISDSNVLSVLFYKIYGWGLSISAISILFILNKWPGPLKVMILISIITVIISLLLALKLKSDEHYPEINYLYFTRILVALSFLGYIYFYYIN